jgi:hypothetical protein
VDALAAVLSDEYRHAAFHGVLLCAGALCFNKVTQASAQPANGWRRGWQHL